MARRDLVDRVMRPVDLARADHQHRARPVAGADEDVLGARRAVDEVPLPQRVLNPVEDDQARAVQDEEVLLVGLGVVLAVRLAGLHDDDVDARVRPVLALPLEEELRAAPRMVEGRDLAEVADHAAHQSVARSPGPGTPRNLNGPGSRRGWMNQHSPVMSPAISRTTVAATFSAGMISKPAATSASRASAMICDSAKPGQIALKRMPSSA